VTKEFKKKVAKCGTKDETYQEILERIIIKPLQMGDQT